MFQLETLNLTIFGHFYKTKSPSTTGKEDDVITIFKSRTYKNSSYKNFCCKCNRFCINEVSSRTVTIVPDLSYFLWNKRSATITAPTFPICSTWKYRTSESEFLFINFYQEIRKKSCERELREISLRNIFSKAGNLDAKYYFAILTRLCANKTDPDCQNNDHPPPSRRTTYVSCSSAGAGTCRTFCTLCSPPCCSVPSRSSPFHASAVQTDRISDNANAGKVLTSLTWQLAPLHFTKFT